MKGERDSGVSPVRGRRAPAGRATTSTPHLPKGLPVTPTWAQAPARSVLKMNTVIHPITHFCALGVGDAASLKGHGSTSARRSSLVESMDQFGEFVASSTCMGPPLTESPGRCQVHERGHTGSPERASTAVCGAKCACSKDDGDGGSASGAKPTSSSKLRRVLGERPANNRWQAGSRHYEMKRFGAGP